MTRPILPLLLAIFLLSSCTSEANTLRVAEQHGLAYIPLALIQTENLMTNIEWVRVSNATAIREAMAAGRLDVGFMGIPPFLLGQYRDAGWRLVTGLSQAPLGLVTNRPDIESLGDIGPEDRIALPQPGSIQHILLSMAAERTLGNPQIFDNQLVSLSHPDGFVALSTGREIVAHFTTPPFLASALELPNARQILSGTEAFGGPFTFLVGAAAEGWGIEGPSKELLDDFLLALEKAMVIGNRLQGPVLDEENSQVLARLAQYYDFDPQTLHHQLQDPNLRFTSEVQGLEEFGQAMDRFGYLEWPIE